MKPVNVADPDRTFCAELGNEKARRWAIAAISLTVGLFFAVCFRFLSPLPVYDDYEAVLQFVDELTKQPNVAAKLLHIVVAQHNEYKLIWPNLVATLQYWIAGRVDFRVLSVFGDLQVLGIAWLLWRGFVNKAVQGTRRIVLFVPVAVLVFSLNYNETLNWSMAALQNLGVVLFALFSLTMLVKNTRRGFAWGCAGLCMTIAASGNGFGLALVGLLLLWRQKAWARAGVWVLVTICCAAIYAYRYKVQPIPAGATTVSAEHHFRGLYVLAFLGSSCGHMTPGIRYLSIPVGLMICFVAYKAMQKRFDIANPAIFFYMAFLMLTAIGVAVMRSGFGYDQSMSSRYKIYSDLLLACCYSVALYLLQEVTEDRRRKALRAIYGCVALFFVLNDVEGAREMRGRYIRLQRGAALYRQSGHTDGPIAGLTPDADAQMSNIARPLLIQAEKDGIYKMP